MFFDFDGTIATVDTGVHLLERVGHPRWREIDARYGRGEIGSRECMQLQLACLPLDEALLRKIAGEVPIDPAFEPLVASLRAAGAEVTVVSDGFGFYVDDALAGFGLQALTNGVDFSAGLMTFPNVDRCCPCSTCGTCKQAPLKDARHRGRTTVFVGDGISDRKAAMLADVLFATAGLAEWCELMDVPFRPFDSLADVAVALVP